MKFLSLIMSLALMFPTLASAADYYSLGDWMLGENKETTLPLFSVYLESDLKNDYQVQSDSLLGSSVSTKLKFVDDNLQSLEYLLYEGREKDEAVSSLQKVLGIFEKEFNGGNFEGLTTSEGLKDELVVTIVDQLMLQLQEGLKETAAETGELLAFEMYLSFSTEYVVEDNYLYGQFRFDSASELYSVVLWEDQEFQKERLPKTMVILKAGEEEIE